MNDEFDDLVGEWLRESARPDPAKLAAVRGAIDALPVRRSTGRRGWALGLAVGAALVIAVAAALVYPRLGGVGDRPVPPAPTSAAPSFTPSIPPSLAPSATLGPLGRTWFDAAGAIVPPSTLFESIAPAHCGWESATMLRVYDRLFIRDPEGVLADHELETYDPDIALPADARSTEYHEGDRRIWRGSDPNAIYVVYPDHVERWPAEEPGFGCT
jgi:hypothetical protein